MANVLSPPDTALDDLRRFKVLTLALIDANQRGAFEEVSALFAERGVILDRLDAEALNQAAPGQVTEALALDQQLRNVLDSHRVSLHHEILQHFAARKGRQGYRTPTDPVTAVFDKAS